MVTDQVLRQHILALLSDSPGLSAKQFVAELQRIGVSVENSKVNSILYASSQVVSEGATPPRWHIASGATRKAKTSRERRDDRIGAREIFELLKPTSP